MATSFPTVPSSSNIIDVHIDASATIAFLQLGAKKLDYGLVNAINSTAKAVQAAEVAHVKRAFTVRKPDTLLQAAIIKPFANVAQGRFYATISVGDRPRQLLSQFEQGADRQPTLGAKAIAVPVTGSAARPTFSTAQTFPPLIRKLAFRQRLPKSGKRRAIVRSAARQQVLEGQERTFQTRRGVFQRISEKVVRSLYVFLPHVRLGPKLHFVETAKLVIAERFPVEIRAEVDKAFAYRSTHP